ncbi:MAG: flippase [Bryobacteraceae bacterium]
MIRRLFSLPVARNAAILYAVQIGGYLVSLITVPYLARVLTPAKFGLLAYAQDFIWYFVVLTDYSFNVTATRKIAIQRDDVQAVSRIFSVVMTAKACLMTVGFLALCATVLIVPRFRAEWALFCIVYLTVASYVVFPLWYFQGLEKMHIVGIRDIVSKLAVLAAVFAFVHSENDYRVAAAIQSGGLLVTAILGLAAVPLAAPVRLIRPSLRELRGLLSEGWHVFVSLFLAGVCPSTNVVILGLIASPEQVGIYSAASRIIFPMRTMVGPLVTAVYPHVSHLASSAPDRALRFLRRYAFLLSIPFLFLALGTLFFAPIAVRFLYGPRYAETALLLQIMGVTPLLMSLTHCFSTYFLLAFGFTREWSRIMISGVFVNFLALGVTIWLLRPSLALSVTMVAVDLFILSLSWAFYAARTGAGAAPAGKTLRG